MTQKKITALTGSGQTQPETSQQNIFNEIIPLSVGTIDGKANIDAPRDKCGTSCAINASL
ncbi:hypothetical protein [Pectobacterium polaris]|uniref:hypothetical protein n=1 Tax=Pectobacterium polaris TaxID=2042057 RepID=UPI002B24ECD6|nr:hypothetical protein [Pectobacterium polaris]